ncbi:hypothetical protein ACFXHA_17460 [Nocardia sp. NPDC059240]|uniref:hypothetical protein n=1 Tax=Nocardia sp. NPDC059240 TaxID=3346786 RepID=UPI0036A32065
MPSPSSRAAAIARLAAIAATMAAVPAIAASIAGPAEAAAPPQPIPVGAAALTHLSTLFDQGVSVIPAGHGVQKDTNEPNPFHQFHQSPFHQGGGFNQLPPFHEAPPPHNPPPDPFEQLVDP